MAKNKKMAKNVFLIKIRDVKDKSLNLLSYRMINNRQGKSSSVIHIPHSEVLKRLFN